MISYLISDPKYYTNDPIQFYNIINKVLENNKVDIACFRDKISVNFKELSKVFLLACREHNIKIVLINSHIDIAQECMFDGVHLSSRQFDKINYCKDNNIFTIISTHNEEEIQKAIKYGANMITYSPIFNTPNKGKEKGYKNLKEMVSKYNIPIIALGGIITQEQLFQIRFSKAAGFASIRYFAEFS